MSNCCAVMDLVLERAAQSNGRVGLSRERWVKFNNGKMGSKIVCRFPKAKRDDDSEYGYKSPYRNSTYAPVEYCPFCGKQQPADWDETAEEAAS